METTLPPNFEYSGKWFSFGEKKHMRAIGKVLPDGKKMATLWNWRTSESQTLIDNIPVKANGLTASGYAKKKRIKKTPLQINDDIFIPFLDANENLATVQKITKVNGKYEKFFEKGSSAKEIYHALSEASNPSIVLIGEGYATCEAIHQMVGDSYLVVCAATASNIPWACEFFAKKYPKAKVMIIGDNDERGLKTPFEAGYPAIFPDKQDPDAKIDWNDVFVEDSEKASEELHRKINAIVGMDTFSNNESDLNFIFLGSEKNKMFFFHKETKDIHELDGENVSIGKLIYLAPLEYWDDNFAGETKRGKKGVCDIRSATDFLVRESLKVKYIKNKVRGTGVWKEENGIVVNSLNKIWHDGKESNYGEIKKHIYISENTPFLNWTQPAQKNEVIKLYELISRLSWKNSISADFLFSWLALAPLAGLLEWRSHIWVCGGRGSGKSEVKREIILPMLNIEMDGADNLGSTEAGIRQSRQVSAAPLVYDEAEVTDERTKNLLDSLVRTISLASDSSNSKIVKGSSGGKSSSFNVNFSACLFSVGINSLEHPQYRSRFSILELVETKDNGYMGAGGTQEQLRELLKDGYCDRFFSSVLERLPVFHRNFEIFYKILKNKVSARFAQQVGTLLAGSYTMQFLPDANLKEIEKFISDKNFQEENLDNSVKNEQNCLDFLFSKKIVEIGKSYTIGELVEDVQGTNDDVSEQERKEKLLQRHGIKYIHEQKVLAISNTNAELKNIFRGTAWETGWSRTLGRLPFVFQRSHQVKMNGQNQRCTCIDLIKFNNGDKNDE